MGMAVIPLRQMRILMVILVLIWWSGDGTGTITSQVDLTVVAVNDPPVAESLTYTINEDEVLTFNESQIVANASDIEGDVSLVDITYTGNDGIFSH
ncbi:cadherin-like domain-containing protein [Vibrio sp. SS-MA-C1-2]|uniref:cadherin-like domain-containing protein n=1 Tax=Vibrio sp. SS-MA-C1-2 TaxID=2908646 RepID=UPI0038FD3272